MDEHRRLYAAFGKCALSVTVALLAACGGGGGGGAVRSTPPPAGGSGIGFTPTVANDASLTQVNPPTVAVQSGPATLPQYSRHLVLTNAAGALGAGLLGQGVTIGFVDSGVNRSNPALTGRITYFNKDEYLNPATNDLSVDDKVGHGTVVAEMAAGKAIGSWGGGVAQGASIVAARIISDAPPPDDGSGEGNEIGAGQGYGDFFKYVNNDLSSHGAKIINNSWGGLYWDDPALTVELATAWKDFVVGRGGIIVFANGNAGDDPALRPEPSDNARLPTLANDPALEKGWLTVAALNPDNPTALTSYSQQCGSAMNYCLAAPGNVVFIDPQAEVGDASYDLWQGGGTSFATPQVSGAAAVVWSAFPYFSNDQARQAILGGAKDLGAAGVDPVFGWGLLDVSKAANGPSNFAWGDFNVSFSGSSVWRNSIVGSGGLIKSGSGTLTIDGTTAYTGATRILEGGANFRFGLGSPNARSNVFVGAGATLWANIVHGDVENAGRLFTNNAAPLTIFGNFKQTATGNLGVWLHTSITSASGTGELNGQISILGIRSGYTATSREVLFSAAGGISGTFSSVKAAPNVFLDATLAYDATRVYLDIKRIDVSKAVAGMSLSDTTQMSATRIEGAMQAIDGQLASGVGTIGTSFIDAAGALQQIASVAQADRAIRSLSGEMHAVADAAGLDNLEAGRRALSSRFGELAGQAQLQGNWYRALGQPGQGGSAFGQFQNDGWLMGSDQRLGANAVAGFAFGTTDTDGFLSTGYDRSHERQTQARFYAGAMRGKAYALGQLGAGRYERQLRRAVLLGDRVDGVATDYAGNFTMANLEAGYRFGAAKKALVPYVGVDYVRLDRDGFIENGAAGFGLKTNDSIAERTLAVAGLRGEHAWTTGSGLELALRGYAEWQRTLSERGLLAQASFVGADAWSPLYGEGFTGASGLFGVGLDAALSRRATLSFGYDQRFGSVFDDRQWSAKLRYGF